MKQLDDDTFLESIKAYGGAKGIYNIYSFENKKPKPITRLGSIDGTGLLYIGSSKNLKERLGMLYRVTHGKKKDYKTTAHTFGVKYNKIKIIENLFPIETLFIEIKTTKDYKKIESNLLKEYLNKHGELPPLNSNYPQL